MLELQEYADAQRLANSAIQRHPLNVIIKVQAMLVLARALNAEGDEAGSVTSCVAAADEARRVGLSFLEASALYELPQSAQEEYASRRRDVVAGLQSDERELTGLLEDDGEFDA